MGAVGLLEAKGLPESLEALDAMCKAASVTLIEAKRIGGGVVTLILRGDVAAVTAAIEAGSKTMKNYQQDILCAYVIPNPHPELARYLTAGASING